MFLPDPQIPTDAISRRTSSSPISGTGLSSIVKSHLYLPPVGQGFESNAFRVAISVVVAQYFFSRCPWSAQNATKI